MKQYKQLTLKERYQIQAFLEMDFSARLIANKLNRSNKTISSEINRCKKGCYHADCVHKSALKHRYDASKRTKINKDVIQTIDAALKIDLSPEQIAGRTQLENPSQSVSMHTIDLFIRSQGWRSRLPRGGKKYRQRTATYAGAKLIPNRVDIEQRPVDVDLKKTVGHWEADTVHAIDGYFVSLVERKTQLFLFQHIQRKTKSEVARGVIRLLKPFKKKCDSMTFDNGGEFADHEFIAKRLKCKTYFAKPYHSWQRGLNENSNGLLTSYFPKKTSIASISEQYLANVVYVSCSNDAYWILKESIGLGKPVVFLESKSEYWSKGIIETNNPFSKGVSPKLRVVSEGDDVTILTWGPSVAKALIAVENIECDYKVSVELIDLRYLNPIDWVGIEKSIRKTHRVVLIQETSNTASLGTYIAYELGRLFESALEVQPIVVGCAHEPMPRGKLMEDFLPSIESIIGTVLDIVKTGSAYVD